MRREETTIVHVEFTYTEAEQKRMEEIQEQLKAITEKDFFESNKIESLIEELGEIIQGVWSEPLPF